MKEGKLKRYQQRVKQYRKNRIFQNNERKFYQQLGWDDTKTYQNKRNQTILDKNMVTKTHNEKAEWINNISRELEGLKNGPKAEIHIDLLKTTLKKISNRKTPDHDGIHAFWFKKFTSIYTYPNGWPREGSHWSKRTQAKEPPQTITDPYLAYRWCRKY